MELDFYSLQRKIVKCRRCPRLVEWRKRVAREKVRRYKNESYWGRPLPAFGAPDSALVIIGLAPAAHGGNRTGRLFTGDRSGDWLYEALHRFGFANQPVAIRLDDGLTLNDCLITAVVRCAPPDNKPLPAEMANCREYLFRELNLAKNKRVVVALGQVAFRAFLKIWKETAGLPSGVELKFGHGREWNLPGGVLLIASYHPSQQNTHTGKLTRPMFHAIFRRAREVLLDGPLEICPT
jgi:uracil-DNA glycosylase family 4